MAEVRRRRVVQQDEAAAPVTRRRDRAAATEEDDGDEVEVTQRPPKRASTRTRTNAADNADDYDDTADGDEEADWDEGEEPEEPRPARRTRTAKNAETNGASADDDDDDDDPPAPRRARGTKKKVALPPGIRTGVAGVEEVRKAGNAGATRLVLSSEPELVKFLEPEPFVSYRQHWASQGAGQGNRPYTCIGVDCPLCDLGDNASQTVVLNILHLSAANQPENKVLQLGIKAWKALQETATSKKTDTLDLERDFFAVSRSGKDQQSQTNFRPVKLRDLEEDWEELLDNFELEELPELIEEAKERVFDISIVQVSTRKQLSEVAAYLAED